MRRDGINDQGADEQHPAAVGLLVTTVSGASSWCLTRVAEVTWPRDSSSGPASVDEVLVAALAWTGALLTGWLALTSLVAFVASAPGAVGAVFERLARLLTPHFARRVLSVTLGASVGTVAMPAPVVVATSTTDAGGRQHGLPAPTPGYAVSSTAVSPVTKGDDDGSTPPAPGPGWLPDRPPPTISPHHARLIAPALRPTSATSDTLTVRRGDTLWSIAAAHLGPGATDAEVAAEWPRWYEANRAVIGDDPDEIVPGQQLRAPLAEVFR
jgi:nucleoid-associated protein YgaU